MVVGTTHLNISFQSQMLYLICFLLACLLFFLQSKDFKSFRQESAIIPSSFKAANTKSSASDPFEFVSFRISDMESQRAQKTSSGSKMDSEHAQKASSATSVAEFDKDLGRFLKEVVGSKEVNVTHSLLEQLLSEIKQSKSIFQSGLARLGHKFDDIVMHQRVISDKLSAINSSLISDDLTEKDKSVLGAIHKTNQLLQDVTPKGLLKTSTDACSSELPAESTAGAEPVLMQQLMHSPELHSFFESLATKMDGGKREKL